MVDKITGLLRNDVLAFTPGQCEMHKSRSACIGNVIGVKCVWDIKKDSCRLRSPNDPAKASSAICEAETADKGAVAAAATNNSRVCQEIKSCGSCVSTTLGCVWCAGANVCRWRHCGAGGGGGADVDANSIELDQQRPKAGEEAEARSDLVSRPPKSPLVAPASRQLTTLEQCQDSGMLTSTRETCGTLHTCHSCAARDGCRWEVDKLSRCREAKRKGGGGEANLTDEPGSGSECSASCSERTTCQNCTHGLCMWCHNLNLCIDRNAYLPSFPYGQCMEWTTQAPDCPAQKENGEV